MSMKIPLFEPNIGKLEKEYVNHALDSGWIGSKGDFIDRFEAKFAKYIGVHHAVTCSSGTSALLLAYLACGMKPDSKVITPWETFAATYSMANVVSQKVQMVKPNPDTWNIDPKVCDADFFIGVHLYGNPLDMGDLYKCKFKFIEDCAQSLGSNFKGKKTGSFGLASCFSFHSAKTITTGEGGMVCTNDKDIATQVRHLKNHCMTEPYKHDGLGWNFRMTNLQAALGLAQLERVEELVAIKQDITNYYDTNLSAKYVRQTSTRKSNIVKWANAYQVKGGSGELRTRLLQTNIETRPGFNREDIIMFPSGTTLTKEQIEYVVQQANLQEN